MGGYKSTKKFDKPDELLFLVLFTAFSGRDGFRLFCQYCKLRLLMRYQGHPTSIFGKYLFGRRFEIQNFQNICCKISCLPASPRIFEHLKNGIIAQFLTDLYPKKLGAFFLAEIFEKVNFDPHNFLNFRITRPSARKSEQMKNF